MATQKHLCQLQDDPSSTVYCWHQYCANKMPTLTPVPALTTRPDSLAPTDPTLTPVSPLQSPVAPALQRLTSNEPANPNQTPESESSTSPVHRRDVSTDDSSALLSPSPVVDIEKSLPSTPGPSARASYTSIATGATSPIASVGASSSEQTARPQSTPLERNISHQSGTGTVADKSAEIEQHKWQEFSPPPELHSVEDDIAPELATIVKESMARQWQIAQGEQHKDKAPKSEPQSAVPNRANSTSNHSIHSPIPANEDTLERDQPGLQVLEGPKFMNSKEASRFITDRLAAPSVSSSSMHRKSISEVSTKSSSTKNDKLGRPASMLSSESKKASSKTIVPVGPMGFMDYNRSNATQERYVPPKPVSPWAEKWKKRKESKKPSECISCVSDVKGKDLVELDCKHKYCKPCFSTFMLTSMQDEKKFPPKCCLQAVPPKLIQSNLSSDNMKLYKLKEKEYSIPPNARFYCPVETCTKWINTTKSPVVKETNQLKCPHCKNKMCTICRGPVHGEWQACPQDFALEATIEESNRQGYQRCYSCRTMVEHTEGCRHMVCSCKAEFCYVCAARWQTCTCTEEDQFNRQQEIQNRNLQLDVEAADAQAAIRAVEQLEREEMERAAEEAEHRRIEAEKQRVERRTHLDSRHAYLITALTELQQHQTALMLSRQEKETTDLLQEHTTANNDASTAGASPNSAALAALQAEHQTRAQNLALVHRKALEDLEATHQEQEDETFIRITMQLRGKPNADARAKKMTEQVTRMQADERSELQADHEAEFTALLRREKAELLELNVSAATAEWNRLQTQSNQVKMQKKRFWAENEWMKVVGTAREKMLDEEMKRQFHEIDHPDEATGENSLATSKAAEAVASSRPVHPLEEESRRIHSEYGVTY